MVSKLFCLVGSHSQFGFSDVSGSIELGPGGLNKQLVFAEHASSPSNRGQASTMDFVKECSYL